MKYYSNNLIKRTEPKIIYNNGNRMVDNKNQTMT